MMPKKDRWRKALTFSLVFHCLLLVGAGWLGGALLKAAPLPDIIEVELVSGPGRSDRRDARAPDSAGVVAGPYAKELPAIDEPAVAAEATAGARAEVASARTGGRRRPQ